MERQTKLEGMDLADYDVRPLEGEIFSPCTKNKYLSATGCSTTQFASPFPAASSLVCFNFVVAVRGLFTIANRDSAVRYHDSRITHI